MMVIVVLRLLRAYVQSIILPANKVFGLSLGLALGTKNALDHLTTTDSKDGKQ